MDTASIPIPGTLRLRPLQPLVEADGSCHRVFDLERAAEVEVPVELRLHVAAALESGDFDEDLLSWLVSAGLITSEGRQPAPAEADVGAEGALRGCCRLDGELHARLDLRAEEGLPPALDLAFATAEPGERVVLHLGCGGAFPSPSTLEDLVVEAEQRSYETARSVAYELALAPAAVTDGIVRFVAGMPLRLRLACEVPAAAGARPAWRAAEEAAGRVLAGIPDQLTFQAVLPPGARLRDLLLWARERHLLHLDVLLLGAHPLGLPPAAVAAYRADLLVAAKALAADLVGDGEPLDLQPLTAAARRLLRPGAAEAVRVEGLVGPPAPSAPGPCPLRRAEAEAALLLNRRLAGQPGSFARRLLEEMGRAPLDPFSHAAWAGEALSIC